MWHNNFVIVKIPKGYRAKEMGFYLDDTNSDYNSNTARYFTIHLVHSRKAKKAGKEFPEQKARQTEKEKPP